MWISLLPRRNMRVHKIVYDPSIALHYTIMRVCVVCWKATFSIIVFCFFFSSSELKVSTFLIHNKDILPDHVVSNNTVCYCIEINIECTFNKMCRQIRAFRIALCPFQVMRDAMINDSHTHTHTHFPGRIAVKLGIRYGR